MSYCEIAEPVDHFKKLVPLAERLGVNGHEKPTAGISLLAGGKHYDLIELLDAFLDKMDKVLDEHDKL